MSLQGDSDFYEPPKTILRTTRFLINLDWLKVGSQEIMLTCLKLISHRGFARVAKLWEMAFQF